MGLNVILPAAFTGIRKNSNKPKICVEFIDSQPLYQKQIHSIHEVYPSANITYVLGFHSQKVDKDLEKLDCNVVYNDNYHNTNVAYSISLALEKINGPSLVIYGDLYFCQDSLKYLPRKPSGCYLVKDEQDSFCHKNVGIGPNTFMDFAFKDKWSQMMYLSKQGATDFYDIATAHRNTRKFSHEIINEMQEQNSSFYVVSGSGYTREIDRVKELNAINKHLFEEKQ